MTVLRRGYLSLLMAIMTVPGSMSPAVGVVLLVASLGLVAWTIAAYRSLPIPRPWSARIGVSLAAAPFVAAGLGGIFFATLIFPPAFFLALILTGLIGTVLTAARPERAGATRAPALLAAGIALATDVWYVSIMTSQGWSGEDRGTFVAFSVTIAALALAVAGGGVMGHPALLWSSALGFAVMGILGVFSIGLPLLLAAALAVVAAISTSSALQDAPVG